MSTKTRRKEKFSAKSLKGIGPHKYSRIMGIDASTTGIACCLVINGQPVMTSKLELKDADIFDRLKKARKWLPKVFELYKPELAVIEAPVFVQNHQTVKNLAYVAGILIGELLYIGVDVVDVSPLSWKTWLGYKKINKSYRQELTARLGETGARKEISRLRKYQTIEILEQKFPYFSWKDDDIADSCGIALWGWNEYGKIQKEDGPVV